MHQFMDKDFLLDTPAARTLYHDHAEACPIIDYHNHLNTKDIANARHFDNLAQIWLEGDHYKWRAMRACGVDESLITGKTTSDYEKFLAWAEVVPQLAGCPLYHWTHLELQRYFGITETLTPESAPRIWEKTREMLKGDGFDTVSLLMKQNVKVLCTTDDPADSLEWHRKIKDEGKLSFKVLPSFRPDRFLSVEAPAFRGAVAQLEERNGKKISSLDDLKTSLTISLDRFADVGCRVSDHGFSEFPYGKGSGDAVFTKAMAGEALTAEEIADYKGDLMRYLGAEYKKRGIAMQLHLGPIRNVRPSLYETLGPDAGGDSVGPTTDPFAISAFLGDLDKAGNLPHTVLYNMNPADNIVFSTMAVDFAPDVQFGAAWWLNDTLRGIENQIDELMETGQLAKSIGMLTDSRSFTSFPRHEYYRRILCRHIGRLVEDGLYPEDMQTLGTIVENVCCRNAEEFFGF